MKKIAIVTSSLENGGITTVIFNYLKNIDCQKFKIDLISYEHNLENESLINELNFQVYIVKNPKDDPNELKELFLKNKYDIIHCCTYYNSGIVLKIASKAEVPCRICHSHASKNYRSGIIYHLYEKYMLYLLNKYATLRISCSNEAAKTIFAGKKYIYLPNAIEAKRFDYNDILRDEIRNRYNILSDTFVIGTVGMFSDAKNHAFLIDVFKDYLMVNHNSKLLIVGDGKNRSIIENKIAKLDISSNIIITGWQKDTSIFYSAMDIFVLPSISEGFPLVLLEAQANGLKSLISTNVTRDVDISKHNRYLSINDRKPWVKALEECRKSNGTRKNYIINTQYDIKENIKLLENIYDGGSC